MPRPANFNKNVDDCLTISTTKLKEWNYFTKGSRSGVISWSRNDEVHSKIGIQITFKDSEKYITLDYTANGEPKNYKVKIIEVPSNLGKGYLYYFKCPITHKLCRKLYLDSGMFLHRTAFNMIYQKQTESKKHRELTAIFDKAFVPDAVYQERYKKYFKTHYNGKPTKRFLKFENRIQLADRFPSGTLERLMMR
ncbi:hypothetical protein [Flavobacterium sp. 7A]|uniref:hypothetical protein n=1 Tax=Flavobacterium sp. 7A TaxID=2940571 RepID=UPI00222716A2|nr:hypothetical protein [Flavobacterium sp. 7A]MCW2120543.1 hypothetical protein [Flavobacterium sp. 7A]